MRQNAFHWFAEGANLLNLLYYVKNTFGKTKKVSNILRIRITNDRGDNSIVKMYVIHKSALHMF